jgi:hypothetical protein
MAVNWSCGGGRGNVEVVVVMLLKRQGFRAEGASDAAGLVNGKLF